MRKNRGNLALLTIEVTQCPRLLSEFGSIVSLPGSPEYDSEQNGILTGYWTLAAQQVMPACRVTPKSSEDVSVVVKLLAHMKCHFAIRGAGHMTWPGAANTQDGVTVDLSSMNKVSLSADMKVTSVGPGCRWRDVYNKLDPLNLTVVGGRVDNVGVAGLIIGGGNSWFSSRYGFACDNVVNFEVSPA